MFTYFSYFFHIFLSNLIVNSKYKMLSNKNTKRKNNRTKKIQKIQKREIMLKKILENTQN